MSDRNDPLFGEDVPVAERKRNIVGLSVCSLLLLITLGVAVVSFWGLFEAIGMLAHPDVALFNPLTISSGISSAASAGSLAGGVKFLPKRRYIRSGLLAVFGSLLAIYFFRYYFNA